MMMMMMMITTAIWIDRKKCQPCHEHIFELVLEKKVMKMQIE
jgi:hypothetical protein